MTADTGLSGDDRAWADLTLAAEVEHDQGPLDHLPMVPPARMRDFAREWRRRPHLRALIAAAARLGEVRCARSPVARALWEMSRSDEWIADRCPHAREFLAIGMPLRAPA